MDYKLCCFLEIFIIDFFVWLLLKKFFRLSVNFWFFVFSQTVSIVTGVCCYFLPLNTLWLLLIKFISSLFVVLLITNDYKAKHIFSLHFAYIVTLFAIFGYFEFLYRLITSFDFAFLKIENFKLIFAGGFVLFYLILWGVMAGLPESVSKNFLAKVSFSLNDQHITLKGLIDSGNMVYDSKTHEPVIFVSIFSLQKQMPLASFDYISNCLAKSFEKCVLVGGQTLYVPIVSVKDCRVIKNKQAKKTCFKLGIIKQKFYDEKRYDCLIHRDFA